MATLVTFRLESQPPFEKLQAQYQLPIRLRVRTGMVASIWYGWVHIDAASTDTVRNVKGLILGLWVLLPPLWFWAEYFFIYKDLDESVKPKPEEFKYGQDLSAKIWLAVVSLLAALYFHKAIAGGG